MPKIEETFPLFETSSGRVSDEDFDPQVSSVTQQQIAQQINTVGRPHDAVDELVQEMEDEQSLQEELSDVELRLEEANCYKALLRNPLFGEQTTLSRKVEAEVRGFIKERLRELIGIKERKPVVEVVAKSDFSPEELKALKMLASRVMTPPKAPNAAPTVNRATVEPPKTTTVTRANVEEPTVNAAPVVPEKVKPVRKKKDVVVKEVNLPDGTVKRVEIPVEAIRRRKSPQEIADEATAAAMIEAANKVNPLDILTGGKK